MTTSSQVPGKVFNASLALRIFFGFLMCIALWIEVVNGTILCTLCICVHFSISMLVCLHFYEIWHVGAL